MIVFTAQAKAKTKPEVAMTAFELATVLACFRVRLGYFGKRRAWVARGSVITDAGVKRISANGRTPIGAVEELLRQIGSA